MPSNPQPPAGPSRPAANPARPAGPAIPSGPVLSRRVHGTIRGVDVASGVIVLVLASRGEFAVHVPEGTAMERNNRPARLSDLKPGDAAFILYRTAAGLNIAIGVSVQSAHQSVEGWLAQVDGRGMVTITDRAGRPFVFRVGGGSLILYSGRQIDFGSLTPGHAAIATFDSPQGRELPTIIRLDIF